MILDKNPRIVSRIFARIKKFALDLTFRKGIIHPGYLIYYGESMYIFQSGSKHQGLNHSEMCKVNDENADWVSVHIIGCFASLSSKPDSLVSLTTKDTTDTLMIVLYAACMLPQILLLADFLSHQLRSLISIFLSLLPFNILYCDEAVSRKSLTTWLLVSKLFFHLNIM